MAANRNSSDNLAISDESLSSLFEEIDNYSPKSPLQREPSVRAASSSSASSRRVGGNTTNQGQSQRSQSAVNKTQQPQANYGHTRQAGSYNKQQFPQQSAQPAAPRQQPNAYSQQPVLAPKKKDHSLLKFIIGIVIILAVLRACGIIGPQKDTKSTKVEETEAVETVIEVPEEETVDLVFDSKYLLKHGPAEQLERLSLRLDCEEFTRTEKGKKLAITTKRNEFHEKIIHYLSEELPQVSRADFPNFLEITSNDDFTEFEFTVAAVNLYQHEENYMKDVLMIAQMNAELNGNPDEVITIVFKNMNGDTLREKDTKISG